MGMLGCSAVMQHLCRLNCRLLCPAAQQRHLEGRLRRSRGLSACAAQAGNFAPEQQVQRLMRPWHALEDQGQGCCLK